MQVQTTLSDMERFEFNMKPYYNIGPIAQCTLKHSIEVSVHDASDEQIAAAFDTGLAESIRVIVNRPDGHAPFLTFDVCIPGANVKYFWYPESRCEDDEVAVLVKFREAMTGHGCSVAGSLAALKRMAGVA